MMDNDWIEWVLWLQRDAAYLYAEAAKARDSGKPTSGWVATLIQENAAHSAALERGMRFGDEISRFDALTDEQIRRAQAAGEGGSCDSPVAGQRSASDDVERRQAPRG